MKTQIHSYTELQSYLRNQVDDEYIHIKDCEILFDVNVEKIIQLLAQITNNTINRAIDIRNCEFRKIEVCNITFGKEITIISSLFQDVYVNDTTFCHDFSVVDCIIERTILKNSHFNNNVSFGFDFKTIIQTIDVEDVVFEKDLKFSNLWMSRKIDKIGHSESSLFNIYGRDTIIKHDLIIQNSMFLDSIMDIRCNVDNEFRLYEVNEFRLYDKDNELINIIGYVGTLQFHDSRVSTLNIMHCKLAVVDIVNSMFNTIIEYNFQCKRMTNDAALIFRMFAIKNSDPILEEKYTAQFYDNLLKQKTLDFLKSSVDSINKRKKFTIGNKKNVYYYFEPIILFFTSIFSMERFLLWLNKYSNDFNRSWTRDIIFTLLATLIFYFIINYLGTDTRYFIIDFKFQNFDEVLKGYLSLLDIFKLSGVTQPMNLNIWGELLLFIAKIVVAYGSWQTIYAFYKYKR